MYSFVHFFFSSIISVTAFVSLSVLVVYFFVLLSSVPLKEHTTVCFFILHIPGLFPVWGYCQQSCHVLYILIVSIFMWTYIFTFLGYAYRSGIIESKGKCMFKFIRNCQTSSKVFRAFLDSHQQCMSYSCTTSFPTLGVASINFSHSDGCVYQCLTMVSFVFPQ